MEATAAASPAANLPGGLPAVARDVSQPPGSSTIAPPQHAENLPNGVQVNNVDGGKKGTASHDATPVPEPARPASRTPPLPLSTQPPSRQPPSAQPPSAQPPPTQPPSTQPLSTQPPPPLRLSSMSSQASPTSTLPRGQYFRWEPPTAPSPRPAPPPSSQAEQLRRPREVNGVPKKFPSPDIDHASVVPRYARDLALLADAVQQSCPEAVREIVRDKWEKCITGSEFHHAFIMNAMMHHASGVIVRRAIRDFGQRLVLEAKQEIAAHLGPEDLDDIAPAILEKCSDMFLDRMLEHRLATIDARSLINALARAERLGYTNSDVLEDRRQERVVPTAQMHSPEAGHMNPITSSQSQAPSFSSARVSLPFQSTQYAPTTTDLKCRLCWRTFKHTKPYEYHVAKQLCTKAASDPENNPISCEDCGATFTTRAGQQYHIANKVCGMHTTAAATPISQSTTPRSEAFPPGDYSQNPMPSTQLPPNYSQPYSTPSRTFTDPRGTPGSSQDDPYRHLTPQRRAELDEELRQAEISYAPRFREAEVIPDPQARKKALESLQNTFSTKQSMIRKRYGVRLRVRRTRAEIEGEKYRMGLKHGPSSPNPTTSTPPAKRQRSDDLPSGSGPSYVGPPPLTQTPNAPPTNHLSVSQMDNSGLGGTAATAATTDPTAPITSDQPPAAEENPPPSSLSSLQRKGYRVSSHVGQATQPASASPGPRSGSASTPVVLDDSSDGTDTDEDIPATLPVARKPSGLPTEPS